VEDLQLVIELTEIQQMQSKESFSQFEHKVFKSLKHENDQNETPPNGAPKRNKNVHVRPPRRRPCFNCGENNHSQNQCRFNARLECYQCHSLGHKAKLCRIPTLSFILFIRSEVPSLFKCTPSE
jgi:hypothetical protein